MAHYRKIDARIWNDAKFVSLTERGKIAFFFLLTHPNQSMLGAMRATIPGLSSELYNMSSVYRPQALLEGFQKGLEEGYVEGFLEAIQKGMVKYDDKACLIWLPNFLKYNRPESPNVVKSWPHVFDLLPECTLKEQIFQSLEILLEGYTKGFRQAFAEGFGKPMPKTMANQEQEQEQDKTKQFPSGIVFPETSSGPAKPSNGVLFTLPQNNGKGFLITQGLVDKLATIYPAVDVTGEIRNMDGWLLAHPHRRKTKQGMLGFITRWLKQEQAKAEHIKIQMSVGAHDPNKKLSETFTCYGCGIKVRFDDKNQVEIWHNQKCKDDHDERTRVLKEKMEQEKKKGRAIGR